MALDHFVSQVHLRKFYSAALDSRKMFGTRKNDLKSFPCGSEDVCRIDEGSTNPFLSEPRALEEFLKGVEPRYSAACAALGAGEPSQKDVFAVAGFVAFVLGCSPTAIRLQSRPLAETVRLETSILDRLGKLPTSPRELGSEKLSQLIENGTIQITIDPKFPQALGISGILDLTSSFGNFRWDVPLNSHDDSPFFTSDFPVAVEPSGDPAIVLRVIPLTPQLAIRIYPRLDLPEESLSLNFQHFSFRRRTLTRQEVRAVNQTIVRSAESLVFHSVDAPWVKKFVMRNANFRVENEVTTFPSGTGFFSLTRTVVRERGEW